MRRAAPADALARQFIRGPRARCPGPSRTGWPYPVLHHERKVRRKPQGLREIGGARSASAYTSMRGRGGGAFESRACRSGGASEFEHQILTLSGRRVEGAPSRESRDTPPPRAASSSLDPHVARAHTQELPLCLRQGLQPGVGERVRDILPVRSCTWSSAIGVRSSITIARPSVRSKFVSPPRRSRYALSMRGLSVA